jgi:adenylate cyclase
VADPLEEIRKALDRVRKGDLDVTVPVDDGGEVGLLQSGVNQMVHGLRERQRLADLFGRHVGTEVAERALAQGSGLSSEQREASALFVDLIGSTAMAEVLPPEAVVEALNSFFGAVVRVVAAEGGWVNKFEGDGALCVFGAPAVQPDHAARALRAARRLRDELRALTPAHPGLDAAIGVSSGQLVAGNVGTEQRYEYTVIGRPVNEAARLSDLAKDRGARVLASAEAIERSGDEATHWMSRGTVGLRGQATPTAIYEPIEVREPATA